MAKEIKNIGASVRARLLQLAKASGQSFDLVLTRFALERLLFRLSQSPHADRFVLKGAMLMMSWFDDPHRGTRDLDLLGFGDPSPEPMLATFREILAQDAGDGVEFDAGALRVDRIREELEYGGLRLRTTASISGARISLTIDIGFGDALEPGAEELDYPSMLDFPMPRLRGYARETVIAEKFQAMVSLRHNILEGAFRRLLEVYLGRLAEPMRDQLLLPLNNSQRNALLRRIACDIEPLEMVRHRLLHFLAGFSICSENRNIALHASGHLGETHFHFIKQQSAAPFEHNIFSVSLADLHGVCNAMLEFTDFAWTINAFVMMQLREELYNPTRPLMGPIRLPLEPALPMKLSPPSPGQAHPDGPILF